MTDQTELAASLAALPKAAISSFRAQEYFYNFPLGIELSNVLNLRNGWGFAGWAYAASVRTGTQPYVCLFIKEGVTIWAHTSPDRMIKYANALAMPA